VREPRDLHVGIVQEVGYVVGSGLAVDGGVERQDDLADRFVVRACNQSIDGEVIRPDAVERRQRAPQHVVTRADRACPFQRPQVGDVGDHHDDRRIAARVGADGARALRIDVPACAADDDGVERRLQRGRERRHQRLALLDQVQRGAPGGARPEPRQSREQLDQPLDLRSGDGFRHGDNATRRWS
jgi:hypothetical protein